MEFDETEAIKFIKNSISTTVDDDDILNIIDIIWDYYEDNGFLDITADDSTDDNDETVVDDLVRHAQKINKKDKQSTLSDQTVEEIVRAEIKYENTLDIF